MQNVTCPNVSCSVAGIPAGECCTTCGEWVGTCVTIVTVLFCA